MGPQYTRCVEAADYKGLDTAWLAFLGVAAGVALFVGFFTIVGLLVASALAVEAFRIVLEYMLNGKLICLHRSHPDCPDTDGLVLAIGEVADIEEVGQDKNPIGDVDNDYSINIILSPASHKAFALNGQDSKENLELARAGPQGDLLQPGPGIPTEDGAPKYGGYSRTMVMLMLTGSYESWTDIVGRDYKNPFKSHDPNDVWADYLVENAWLGPKKYEVPTLHCEFEGSRIYDLLSVIKDLSFAGKWCRKNIVFKIICKLLQAIMSPLILFWLLAVWFGARDGAQEDALLDPAGGTVGPKDMVLMRGRWVYDAYHSGYNELHAVRTLQKVFNVPTDDAGVRAFLQRWCGLMDETPLGAQIAPTSDTPPPTPKQAATLARQRRPENGWTLHPRVDGCAPEPPPPPVPH